MLKHRAANLFLLFVFVSFSSILFAQKIDKSTRNTVKCMHCKKAVDKSDIVLVPQYFLNLPDIQDPIRQLEICSECNKLPKCRYCQMPTKEKMDDDGIYLCGPCKKFKPRYLDRAEAQRLTDEVRAYLASKLKMTIKQKVKAEVDSTGNICKRVDSIAYYSFDGTEGKIYLPDDLQKSGLFYYPEAAHELAHAWYGENGFPLVSGGKDPYCEGFAQFVCWCYLESRKAALSDEGNDYLMKILLDDEMKMIEGNAHPAYGDGFRMIRALMGNARTAPEWKKILQKELGNKTGKNVQQETPKGSCAYCTKPAGVRSAGGDPLCADCAKTSVKDKAEAERIMKDVRRVLSSKFKMTSRHTISYGTGTRNSLGLESGNDDPELGAFVSANVRNKPQYTIRILAGMPRDVFRATGAHQLAHDWMDENLPHLMDVPEVREGFAEYVAWSLSKAEGSSRMADRTENRTDDVYGGGFRKMKNLLNGTKTATEWKSVLLREYPAKQAKKSGR